MILSDDLSVSIRRLARGEFEDYRNHLLRLDEKSRTARFCGAVDDDFIQSYCLRLLSGPAIVVAAFNRGQVRGGGEIEIEAETAQLAFSVETGWQGRGLGRQMLKESLITSFGAGAESVRMVLPESNDRMRGLAKRFGFHPAGADAGTVFVKPLDSLTPILSVA